MNHNKEKKEA